MWKSAGFVLGAGVVVRGGAALDVDRAVLHQRDAVGRGHFLVFDLDLLAQLLADVVDRALAELDVVADVLAFAERVRQRARGATHAHDDGARVLDLLERVGGLRLRRGGDGQQGGDQKGLLHVSSWFLEGERRFARHRLVANGKTGTAFRQPESSLGAIKIPDRS